MASEQSTDIILDLVYGELSADEETAARASVAKDPALAAELAAFEALRGQMGEFLVPEVPRMSVRDSLLAEASKQASRKSPEANIVGRRPVSDGVESLGFWRRAGKGKASQLALVATVLLTGVFVMRSGSLNEDASMAPAMYESAPTAQLKEFEPPAMPTSPVQEAEVAEEPKLELAQDEGADTKAVAALGDAIAEPAEDKNRQTVQKSAPREKLAAKPTSRGQANSPELKRDSDLAYATKSKKVVDSLKEVTTGNASNSPAPARAPRQDAKPSAKSPADFASEAPAAAEADDRQQRSKDAYNSAPGSLDAVEDAYSARDWRQVVQASDAVLEGVGTSVQKARALELKALAYQQMGMVRQALNVYKNIESNYSGYQPDRIRSARTEMERRLDSKPEPSPSRKSKSSVDFEDSTLELK